MTWHGTVLVARQEVRTRLRTGRWKVLLASWFATVNGLALLFRLALESDSERSQAVPMFGGVMLAVLVLTLLVVPALSAQSINGERERGTLATLQVTRLSPGDIAVGKFAAAWGTGLVVLLLTLPAALLPVAEGAIGPGRAGAVLAVIALLIGVFVAVSEGWSAVLARGITSMLMAYLTMFALLVGTPLLFSLALPLTAEPSDDPDYSHSEEHSERVWWLLAPNPVVVLADAAPRLPERRIMIGDVIVHEPSGPLGELGETVEDARRGESSYSDGARAVPPVWPYGLGFDLLLAGGALWITTRRLRTPVRSVPKGIRIA